MTIQHGRITLTTPDESVIFATLLDISCSICAPDSMSEPEIAAFASRDTLPGVEWVVVDKATLKLGTSTPNPCNQVAGRRHWFLMSRAALGGAAAR